MSSDRSQDMPQVCEGSSPDGFDWDSASAALTEERIEQIYKKGYVVIDGFWGEQQAMHFRRELQHLVHHDLMQPNRTQFMDAKGRPFQTTKPHIFELDLHGAGTRRLLPSFSALFDNTQVLADALNKGVEGDTVEVLGGAANVTIKLQVNEGGGSFPLHYDNPGRPNKRRVTMLTYLNPEWAPGDGGELQIVPVLQPPLLLPPLQDRAVFFLSDVMLHRVMPSKAARLCFTIWFDGPSTNLPHHSRLDTSSFGDLEALSLHLATSPAQRLLGRLLYRDAFRESLLICMQGQPGGQEMLEAHERYCSAAEKNAALAQLVRRLDEYHRVLMMVKDFTV